MAFTYAGQYGPVEALGTTSLLLKNTVANVYLVGTTTAATLYTDRTKATAAANPTATDSKGNLTFFADPGRYDVLINGSTVTVAVPMDPAEISDISTSVQTVSVTAPLTNVGTATNPNISVPSGTYVQPVSAPGGVDDTALIHAARDSAGVGGKLLFAAGVYVVNGLLANVAGQTWELQPGTTLRAKVAGSQTVVTVSAAGFSLIAQPGGTIDGNSVGSSAGSTIYVNAASGCTVRGLTLINCAGLGINAQADGVRVIENTVTNAGGTSIFVAAPSTTPISNVRVIDNVVTSVNNNYGISIHGNGAGVVTRAKVRGNDVTLPSSGSAGICIELALGVPRASVSGNTTNGGSMGISVSSSDGVAVTGNVVFNAFTNGIENAASAMGAIVGNTVEGNGVTVACIIIDNTGSTGVVINGNTVRNWITSGRGMSIAGTSTTDIAISGNTFRGTGGTPLYLQSVVTVTINSNTFYGAGTTTQAVAIDTCTDVMCSGNVADNFTGSAVNAFGGSMPRMVLGPNVLAGGTPADVVNGPVSQTTSRVIRGTAAPGGVSAITVTASPFTYTNADQTAEAVYISGGTVSAIAKNAVTLFAASPATVWLEPGEAVTVTYTVAPTMNKDRK